MKMRNRIAVIAASAIMLTGSLPQTILTVCAEETQQTAAVMVATANVNVRTGDSASTKLLGGLKKGQSVTTTGKTAKGWYIVDFNGQMGYVSGKYLTDSTTPTADSTTPAPVAESKPAISTTNVIKTKTESGVTFVCQGYTPKGLEIWCASWDTEGSWPDYMISAYDSVGLTNDMSDYDKAVAINNYICRVVDYASENGVDDRAAYSACLSYGKGICTGYAHAFDCLCTMAGVYSKQVGGIAGGASHSWNYILIDGTKYWVDVTWNDKSNNSYLMSTTELADHVCNYEN